MTRRRLWCGVIAGPLLVGVLLAQALLNPGYDAGSDPISSLSLGPHGWVQVATFVVVGLLVAASGLGVRQLRAHGALVRVGGLLLVVAGAGLVGIGVFVVDPVAWHGRLHDLATGVTINAALLAVAVLAVAWWRAGRRRLALGGLVTALACAALGWPADATTIALRHTGIIVVVTAWLTTTALVLLRESGRR